MSGGDRPLAVPIAVAFDHAREQIEGAARQQWPGESIRLGEQVPSLSSYVHKIRIGGRPMHAKYSLLGASLVSVLRGMHGTWGKVLTRQSEYVRQPDSLLARQVRQLYQFSQQRLLAVPRFAGYRNGVLFTDTIPAGVALDELLLAEPHHAPTLLRRAWAPLMRLHSTPAQRWAMIPERDITATFNRMVRGGDQRAASHFGQLRQDVDLDVVEGLRFVARRMPPLQSTRPATGLVLGSAEPEHIVLSGSERVYLDPAVHVAWPVNDLATLVSRTLLLVMSEAVIADARRKIVSGLTTLIREERCRVSVAASATWMSDLITLIAQDMASVVAMHLTAPPQYPLPRTAALVLDQVNVVVRIIEHAVTWLLQGAEPAELWARLTTEVIAS